MTSLIDKTIPRKGVQSEQTGVHEATKVLVVDDCPVVRAGLISILDTEPNMLVVGEARNGSEAIEKVIELLPDVILVDILGTDFADFEAMVTTNKNFQNSKVIIFTSSDRTDDIMHALRLGAHGYLMKSSPVSIVVDAIKLIANDESILYPSIATSLIVGYPGGKNSTHPELTARQEDVLRLVGEGRTNAEIGSYLYISENTVRTHLSHIMDTLSLRNRAEVVAYANKYYLTDDSRLPSK